jgi:hypothetical protein
MPLRFTQRRNAPQSKMLSRSQTMYLGAPPAWRTVHPNMTHTARQSSLSAKIPIFMIRRE